jgi:hypothetical protein
VSGADLDTDSILLHPLRGRRREGDAVGAPNRRQERRHFRASPAAAERRELHTLGNSDDASTAFPPYRMPLRLARAETITRIECEGERSCRRIKQNQSRHVSGSETKRIALAGG